MSNIVDGKDKLFKDLLKMLSGGSSNDVKIVLEDGEILANKDVLSARCDYFATCFSKFKFTEGETDTVDLSYCSKVLMEKIIHYLFSGRMELQDLSLSDLIKMMNMASMLLLDELLHGTELFVLASVIPESGVNCGSIPELVEGLMMADQYMLEGIKNSLVLEIFLSLKDVPHIPEVVQDSEAFKRLPVNLLKDVLQWDDKFTTEYVFRFYPTTKERFDAFVYWLSENECDDEDKREITDSFTFDNFTGQELMTDVRQSGLFSIKKIDDRMMKILKDKDDSLKAKDEKISNKRKEIMTLKKEVKKLKGNSAKKM